MDSGFISVRIPRKAKPIISRLKARKMLASGRKVTDADVIYEAVSNEANRVETSDALSAIDALAGLWKDKSDEEINKLIKDIYEERQKPWRSI